MNNQQREMPSAKKWAIERLVWRLFINFAAIKDET